MEAQWKDIAIPGEWKMIGCASWKGSDGRLYEAVSYVFIRIYFDTVTERWGATMRDNRQRQAKYTALFWNKKIGEMNEILQNEITQLTELNNGKED